MTTGVTPYLHLSLNGSAEDNRNWAILDDTLLKIVLEQLAALIPPGAITQAMLAKPSVGTPELFDGSVTAAKLDPALASGLNALWVDDPTNQLISTAATRHLVMKPSTGIYFGDVFANPFYAASITPGSAELIGSLTIAVQPAEYLRLSVGPWRTNFTEQCLNLPYGINVNVSQSAPPNAGEIQYAAGHFQGYNGTAWVNLDATGGGSTGWTDTGTALTPTDSTKQLQIVGTTGMPGYGGVTLGSTTAKGRVVALASGPSVSLSTNWTALNAQDDAVRASWQLLLDPNLPVAQDRLTVSRMAPGGTPTTTLLSLDNAGRLTVPGSIALGAAVAAPPDGTLQYAGGHLQARVAGAWTQLDNQSGGLPGGTVPAGDLQGTYPSPTIKPSALPWSVSGATLTPTDATKTVSVPGDATKASLILSNYSTGARVRVQANNNAATIPFLALTANRDAVSGVVDDTTKPAWQILLRPDADAMNIGRVPAGGTLATLLTLDNVGNLAAPGDAAQAWQFYIGGNQTIKSRLGTSIGAVPTTGLYVNRNPANNVMDDNTKPSWAVALNPTADLFSVARQPVGGSGSGATGLLTLDNAGKLTLGSPTSSGSSELFVGGNAATTTKMHFAVFGPGSTCWISNSTIFGAIDDTTKPAWQINLGNADQCVWYRSPAGTTASNVALMVLDGASSPAGNLSITGNTATKNTGTTWANPSDERMKRNVADYGTGLDAITRLRPVSFEYNGELGSVDDGRTCYGFVAQEVEPVMPDCVGTQEWSPPVGEGEPKPAPITIKTLDQSNIILALVNAVKELAARGAG